MPSDGFFSLFFLSLSFFLSDQKTKQKTTTSYSQAIDYSRSQNDFEWTGSALEGLCSALFLLKTNGRTPNSDLCLDPQESSTKIDDVFSPKFDELIRSKFIQAIEYYQRRSRLESLPSLQLSLLLLIEAKLRLADFLSQNAGPSEKTIINEILLECNTESN